MRTYLFSQADVKRLSSELKSDRLLCAGLMTLAVVFGVITCRLVTDENAMLLKTANILVSSLCLCVVVYRVLNRIIPRKARKNHIEKMLRSSPKALRCKVMKEGKKITAIRYVALTELLVLNEEGKELVLYWDAASGKQNFVGHIVEFYVVNNKIVGYGGANEASNS